MSEAFLASLADPDAATERPGWQAFVDALPEDKRRFSPSFIEQVYKCPEQVRRERLLKEPSFATADKLFGTAFHRTAEFSYRQKIESHEDLPVETMREYAGESFNEVVEETKGVEEIRWYSDKPNDVQQGVITAMVGNSSLPGYHQVLAPTVQPVACERWVEIDDTPIGVPLVGKIDLEADDGRVIDLKTSKRSKTQLDLDKSIQATAYLWMRQTEEDAASGFAWHTSVRTIKPQQQELQTGRTDRELAQFERLLIVTANTVGHYMETYGADEPWPGASPMSFMCAPKQCSFWSTCIWRGGAK